MSGTNGEPHAPDDLPKHRGRVCVTGLSGRPFDHADAMGAVAVCVSTNGQVHMHCSIRGAVLLDLLEIMKERYYSAPMRANMAGEMARKAATGIVAANVVPPVDIMPLDGRA